MAKQQEARLVRRSIACNTCGWHTGEVVWQDANYRLIACEHCRLVSLDPLPEEKEARLLYDEAYYQDYYLAFMEARRRFFKERIAALKRRAGGGRLLDVGCGPGFFLAEASAEGFSVQGVEPAPYAATYASHVLGLSVVEGTLPSAGFADASFDIVTLWDVLGHIRNPHQTIDEIARVLVPGGLLVVKMPTRSPGLFWIARMLELGTESRGLLHVPSIMHHFDLDSLTLLLERHSFEVTGWERVNEPKTGGRASSSWWKDLAFRGFVFLRHLSGMRDSIVLYAVRGEQLGHDH